MATTGTPASGPFAGLDAILVQTTELDLCCGGLDLASRACVQSPCGPIVESTDLLLPSETVVGPELVEFLNPGDCCNAGSGSGAGGSCGPIITPCYPPGLPSSFVASVIIGGVTTSVTVIWDAGLNKWVSGIIGGLPVACAGPNRILVISCAGGTLLAALTGTGCVDVLVSLTVDNWCPLTASGSTIAGGGAPCCAVGTILTVTIGGGAGSGGGTGTLEVHYRDLWIPQRFLKKVGAPLCFADVTTCCQPRVSIPANCCSAPPGTTMPWTLWATFQFLGGGCRTFDGLSFPLFYQPHQSAINTSGWGGPVPTWIGLLPVLPQNAPPVPRCDGGFIGDGPWYIAPFAKEDFASHYLIVFTPCGGLLRLRCLEASTFVQDQPPGPLNIFGDGSWAALGSGDYAVWSQGLALCTPACTVNWSPFYEQLDCSTLGEANPCTSKFDITLSSTYQVFVSE